MVSQLDTQMDQKVLELRKSKLGHVYAILSPPEFSDGQAGHSFKP